MKVIKKKKIFKKAMFLSLACMLMLVPFTFGVTAEMAVNDGCTILIGEEEPIMVTMSSCTCGWNSTGIQNTCWCGATYTVKGWDCTLHSAYGVLPHCS